MNDHNLYANCQHGFRKKRSCASQLLEVMEILTDHIDQREPTDMVYLDFRKAFDSAPHERLLSKLMMYGITGGVHSWVKSFLYDRTQRVRVGKKFSSSADVLSGIPQGSILGPVLFTIFINDIADNINSFCRIFADDTKIFNITKNSITLQEDLAKLQEWSFKWGLHFNVNNCHVLHIGYNNPRYTYILKSGEEESVLNICSKEKDLGVIFDGKLSFDAHIQNCISKANRILGIIKRSFSYLDKELFLLIYVYKSMVRPHLEYANSIWSPKLKRQSAAIERVQRPYISDLLHPYCPSRTLRSLDASLLTVPRFSLETFGKKSFSVFGPTVWDSLPLSLRKSQCFTTFKVKLKTHLFRTHLC